LSEKVFLLADRDGVVGRRRKASDVSYGSLAGHEAPEPDCPEGVRLAEGPAYRLNHPVFFRVATDTATASQRRRVTA